VKIVEVSSLAIPDVKTIRYQRFVDHRGYFTEQFRQSDFDGEATPFLHGVRWQQANESFSRMGTIRGMHFQWNPYMGKLVRTIRGHMVDLVLDIRKGSPNYGQAIAYDMPVRGDEAYGEWIWVPPGFAHGNVFPEDTVIEYFCSGEYSPGCEAGISPLAPDIDWSAGDPMLRDLFHEIAQTTSLITDKDRNGLTLAAWTADPRSDNFIYADLHADEG
jgi:dTDP-4-dehydrorhamnose 3,5-epimerase